MKRKIIVLIITMIGLMSLVSFNSKTKLSDVILSHIVDLEHQELKFFWKNKNEQIIGNFSNLKDFTNQQNNCLVFATNGGMYNKDHSPQGLYIENGIVLSELDTTEKGFGNFYMQPNGIFYLSNTNKAFVSSTKNFEFNEVKYATQSGPMLLINGEMHPRFNKGSSNLNIRNGVGVLPNGQLLFAMSKQKINFYDFATYFKSIGCENALYLDGFVSKTYLPKKKWIDKGGNFGVLIGEVDKCN